MHNNSLIKQYKELHATKRYGATSLRLGHDILPHINELRPRFVNDYGCGQSPLLDFLNYCGISTTYKYDPAIEKFQKRPDATFIVALNIDVLEHIPKDDLDSVISDIKSVSKNAIYIVDTSVAKTILLNGSNEHVKVKPIEWCPEKLLTHYSYLDVSASKDNRVSFKGYLQCMALGAL